MTPASFLHIHLAFCALWLLSMVVYGRQSWRRLFAVVPGENERDALVRVEQSRLGLRFASMTGGVAMIAIGVMVYQILTRG